MKFIKNLFYKFVSNVKESFKGYNFIYHLVAIASTYIFVVTGFDWKYFQFFVGSQISFILFPAALVGFLVPVFLPLSILFLGKIRKIPNLVITAFAISQAEIIGLLVSGFYKALTGRVGPPLNHAGKKILDIVSLAHANGALPDISRVFSFGFLRGGVFWGWPSTHTTVAFAMAATIFVMYPKNKIVKSIAGIYALYIGIGISMTIHWFSDFFAGVIFGTLIGCVVGKSFLHLSKNEEELKKFV